jgi:hypothetical protein
MDVTLHIKFDPQFVEAIKTLLSAISAPTEVNPAVAFGGAVTLNPATEAVTPRTPEEIFHAATAIVSEPKGEPVPDVTGVFDKDGLPWDARLHSSNCKMNADGTWRARRGLTAAQTAQITAEIKASLGAAPTPPAPPLPPVPTAPVVEAVAAPLPPVPATPLPPIPAAPAVPAAPAAPVATDATQVTFNDVIQLVVKVLPVIGQQALETQLRNTANIGNMQEASKLPPEKLTEIYNSLKIWVA